MKIFFYLAILSAALLFFGCGRDSGADINRPFGRIGNRVFTIADLEAFNTMRFHHPVRNMDERFPGNRSTTTLFIETQALYPEARAIRRQITNTVDWRWKELYITGYFFQLAIIDRNMGASDDDIYNYWRRNRTELAAEFGIGEGDTLLEMQARVNVVQRLFLNRFQPTEEFAALNQGLTRRDIERMWFDQMTQDQNREAFFRNEFFRRKYGRNFPTANTRAELVGQGRLISEADLRAVMGWIGDGQTVSEDFVVSKMVSWLLFAAEARRMGFTRDENFRRVREQFERFEVVRFYINNVLAKNIDVNFTPNRDMIRYAIADQNRRASLNIDREEITRFADSLRLVMHEASILGYIHAQRNRVGVQLMQSDFTDMFVRTPAQIKQEADSLAANHNTERALRMYRDLHTWFLYAPEGRDAFLEQARLQVDLRNYAAAIGSYRNFMLFGGNEAEWCRVFFTIGYIYAEYLENLPFAAMNYRWILKYQPDCILAQDTEFMYLNLGEPMSDIEELRQMAIRQGRE
jgi:hypothetical protein